jgi:hypothetical protein
MLTASINGVNENESMNKGEEQITPQVEGEEIALQEREKDIEPPDW